MRIEQVLIIVNGQQVRIIDAIARSLQSNDQSLEELFTIMVTFFDAVDTKKLLNLSIKEDFEAFEGITNLAGIVPYITRDNTPYSLREINPSLSEKLYILMLRVQRNHSQYTHKGTAFHNMGASQFSSQNVDNALININEAMRIDFFATGGDLQAVKSRPAFQVLTDDLKKINGTEINNLVNSYNAYFNRSFTTDEFLHRIDTLTRKGFLLKLFLYGLINQYSTVIRFQQESFPDTAVRIPQNEYLHIKRCDCLRDCTIFYEELLRNIMGRPRRSSQTLKPLLDTYLTSRGMDFQRLNNIIDFYWGKRRGLRKDTSLASFKSSGYKTKQINSKLSRIIKGNKSKLGSNNQGKMAKCFLMLGLMRNYTSHHLDLNCNAVKNTGIFEDIFKYSFYCVIFVVMDDNLS